MNINMNQDSTTIQKTEEIIYPQREKEKDDLLKEAFNDQNKMKCEPQYPKTFNLPSIVNSNRESIDKDIPVISNAPSRGLSPEISKRRIVKGLHNYDNKENVCNESSKSIDLNLNPITCDKTGENSIYSGQDQSIQMAPPIDDIEPLEGTSLFESVYELENDSDKIKEHMKDEMKLFNINYDIKNKETLEISESDKEVIYNPTFEDIFEYVKYVAFQSKMEAEIPIISLIYIDKLFIKCKVLMNVYNWRRIVLCTLCIGSKIWDDDSLENVHFPKVMSDITLKDISMLEKAFLNLINYDVIIRGKEYANYYFKMTSLGEESKKNPPWRLMNPTNVMKIENESQRTQEKLKNKYQ
ncbi:unnamed protein product [Moneuplotes crassus]|uniref:Cyclin N-terminal domain-containing protein n=1 Tax=Euplotes crassus TaxID=5936 RepID=A0AAD1XL88_EUPCR|nr:unnamed protein product [Moneuplotes crassus]